MSLAYKKKSAVLAEVIKEVNRSQSVILAEYRGLSVGLLTELRNQARSSAVCLRVIKNTLARRAVLGTSFEGLSKAMIGPLIYAFSADPVSAAKVLSDFAKSNDKLVVKAGAMPGSVLSQLEVKALADLPSRDVLLSTLMGTMQAPIAQFVRTLNEVPSRFVRVLAALRDQKSETLA